MMQLLQIKIVSQHADFLSAAAYFFSFQFNHFLIQNILSFQKQDIASLLVRTGDAERKAGIPFPAWDVDL